MYCGTKVATVESIPEAMIAKVKSGEALNESEVISEKMLEILHGMVYCVSEDLGVNPLRVTQVID